MSRFWIALAIVLWFGTCALAADPPSQVPQWFPPAVTAPAGSRPDAAPTSPPATPPRGLPDPRTFAPPDAPPVMPGVVAATQSHGPWHTQVWHLRNAPAQQLAQTLSTLFSAEHRAGQFDALSRAVIVPNVVSNCLVVASPPEVFTEMQKLIEALDRAAMMIRLEVAMGDVPTADLPAAATKEKADETKVRATSVGVEEARQKITVLFRSELTTLDNQPAYLQAGRREPVITGVSMSSAGGGVIYSRPSPSTPRHSEPAAMPSVKLAAMPMNQHNMVTTEHLGTILTFTPRTGPDRAVTMQFELDDSRFGPADEGVPIYVPSKGEPVRSPVVESLKLQTTIKLADGQTMLLCDMSRQAKNGKQRVVLVTAHVLPIGEQAKQGTTVH
ncbi:MAG: secretin N-terminal domain-containing protein [Thermoguttaceae bacterium]|jgi:hypothetical protein